MGDGNRFFAQGAHVKGKFSRPLHFDHPVVKDSQTHHVFKTLNEGGSVKLWVPIAFGLSFIGQDANQASGVSGGVISGAGGGVRAVQITGLFHKLTTKRGFISGSEGSDTNGVGRGCNRASLRH